jgi:hypothetical protein
MLIMILGPGKCWPGLSNIFAIRLKEYHNCYNAIECQFFIYFRKTSLALKMVPGCKDVWIAGVNFERHGVYLI